MHTFDLLWWPDVRQAVEEVERRLPGDAAAALANVTVTIMPPGFGKYADAGIDDIRIRPNVKGSTAALMGIVAHEAAHVYLRHAQQLRAGRKSVDVCEAEADAQMLAWGFHEEMEHRRLFFGR